MSGCPAQAPGTPPATKPASLLCPSFLRCGMLLVWLMAVPGCRRQATALTTTDLQSRCDSALAAASGAKLTEGDLAIHLRWRIALDAGIGSVVGVDWDSASGRLWFLDQTTGTVWALDTLGRTRARFGRLGDGPGEFWFGGFGRSRLDRLAYLASGLIVVQDARWLQVFDTTGRYLTRTAVDSSPGGSRFEVGVIGVGPSTFITASTGRMALSSQDMDYRTSLDLFRAEYENQQVRIIRLGRARNVFSTLLPFERYPTQQPYRNAFVRTWTATRSGPVIRSFSYYGFCQLDSIGGIAQADRVAVPRMRVTAAEKERVLVEEWGLPDAVVPNLGATPRDLYEGKWPHFAPTYTDVASSWGGVLMGLRRSSATNQVIDAFRDGYLVTVPLPAIGFPDYLTNSLYIVTYPESLRAAIGVYTYSLPSPR